MEVLFFTGYNKEMYKDIMRQVEKNIKEFKEGKQSSGKQANKGGKKKVK